MPLPFRAAMVGGVVLLGRCLAAAVVPPGARARAGRRTR